MPAIHAMPNGRPTPRTAPASHGPPWAFSSDIRDVFRRDVVEEGLPEHPGQPPHHEQSSDSEHGPEPALERTEDGVAAEQENQEDASQEDLDDVGVPARHLSPSVRQPLRVGAHVDHRDGGAGLEPGDQLEQAGRRRFALIRDGVGVVLVAAEVSMRGDATQVERSVRVARGERLGQGLAQRRAPVALERQQAAEDVRRLLRLRRAVDVVDREAGPMELADAGDLRLRVVDLAGVDGLLGLEDGVNALGRDHLLFVHRED